MKVVIIRHAEVDLCWNKRGTSEVFDSDCRRYDSASIKEMMYSSYKSGIVKAFAEKEKRLAKTNAAKNDIKVENVNKNKKADEGIKTGKK